jgi:hypothetical protein
LILIKFSLLDSSRRLECADGHSGFSGRLYCLLR